MDTGQIYNSYLREDDDGAEKALAYLHSRGLTDQTIEGYRLGYVLQHNPPEHRRFEGWLSFPVIDARGEEAYIRFRRLDGERRRKYQQPTGTLLTLYNIKDTDNEQVYITEGEFDTLTLKQLGYNSVALPGAQSWKSHYRWLFRDCELVTVCLDPDDEGDRGADRIMGSLGTIGIETQKIELPMGKDINDLYIEDPEMLRSVLDG